MRFNHLKNGGGCLKRLDTFLNTLRIIPFIEFTKKIIQHTKKAKRLKNSVMSNKNKMKFIYITVFSDIINNLGGVETWLRDFIVAIDKKKDNFHFYFLIKVFVLGKSEKQHENMILNNVNLVKINYKNNFFIKFLNFNLIILKHFVKDYLISRNIIMVSLGTSIESFTGFLFNKTLKIKKILWARTFYPSFVNVIAHKRVTAYILTLLEKINIFYSDLILTNGEDTTELYKCYFRKHSNKFITLKNGIDISRFRDINMLPTNYTKIIISFIGRLSYEKGIIDFLKAIEIFNETYFCLQDKFRFHFVGKGALLNEVKKYEKKFTNVKYIGMIEYDRLSTYYNKIHAAVFLTYSPRSHFYGGSGISISLLECMAAGRLPICWNNKIYTKLIIDGYNGILIPEKNILALTQSFLRLIQNYKIYRMIAKNARLTANNYDINNQVINFFQLLEDLK